MTELALVGWIALIGFAVLSPLWGRVSPFGIGAMAFPTGVAAYVLASLLLLTADAGFSTVAALGVASGAALVVVVVWGRNPQIPATTILATIGVVVGACAAVAIMLQNVHVTRLTADSVRYLVTADALETSGSLDGVNPWDLRMRHLGAPLLHTGGVVAGRGYLASIAALLAASGLATAAWVAWEGFLMWATPLRWRWLLLGATAALLISTNRWLYHAFYVNGHMAMATFLMIGVGATWVAARRGVWVLLIPAAVAFSALPPWRPEATVAGAVFLIPLLSVVAIPIGLRWGLAAPFLAATVLWHGIAYPSRALDGDLGVFGPVYGNLFVAGGIVVLLAVASVPPARRVAVYAPWVMLAGLAGYVGISAARSPRTLEASLAATGSNLAVSGLWGVYWWVVPLFIVGALLVVRFRLQSMWIMSMFGYALALLAFVYLRGGEYRVGTGDSGSRMLVHVALVAIVYVVLAAAAALAGELVADESGLPAGAGNITDGERSRLRGVA
jgi:hypothetical protein